MEEGWKRKRGSEGSNELWEKHEEVLGKVIAREVSEGGGS